MKLPKNFGANKMTYKFTHQLVLGISTTLIRFSDSTGITDPRELRDFIANLSPEEFAKFKFTDSHSSFVNADFDAEFDDPDSVSAPSLDSDLIDSEELS